MKLPGDTLIPWSVQTHPMMIAIAAIDPTTTLKYFNDNALVAYARPRTPAR